MIIGLDVGGTHTDVVLISSDGIVRESKVPTEHSDLLQSVQASLEDALRGVDSRQLKRVVLSTTLATNAIAEGKLPKVGMIVSGGPGIDPELFRICEHYHVISGAIDHRGRETQPVDRKEVEAVASLLRREGIRYVGVVGKFSIRNPAHEIEIRKILGEHFDCVVLGHTLSGNLNFPRRIATAYLNAAIYPIHRKFFEAISRSFEQSGFHTPIYILKADGGTMNIYSSMNTPGQTILSGPSASVMGSVPYASKEGESLVLDIGGTTTDMAVLIRGVPLLDPIGIEVNGYRTLIRALKTHSVALGGDSVVRYRDGELLIGPDRQGPAMAFGGPCPTPTDALIVLGENTGGNREASFRGIKSISEAMGMSPVEAARKVIESVCTRLLREAGKMVEAINSKPVYTIHELLEGYRVRPEEILILGGPAPCFARYIRELSGYRVRIVPKWEIANAIGAALARTTTELTLFVDTQQGFASSPEEGFYQPVSGDFSKEKAVELAKELLKEKAIRQGASADDLELEVVELLQFNIVRSFYTAGRNIRVKAQVKPGLSSHYRRIAEQLGAAHTT